MKYGALSVPTGSVHVVWQKDKSTGRLLFDWKELGGPPAAEPQRAGFGSVILKTIVPTVFGGVAELRYSALGLRWRLEAPLKNIIAGATRPRAA